MYKINHIKKKGLNFITLEDSDNCSFAKISLNQGGNLQELFINNIAVIEDLYPLKYSDSYASSILFPFANRIKDGLYTFQNKEFELEINQKEENNALHGLVFNKSFTILNKEISDSEASVKLGFEEVKESKGFPFTYLIHLQYTLSKDKLKLTVSVKNTDTKPFPFTLGWHPYFKSKDLFNSSLKFESNKKLVLDGRMITTDVTDFLNNQKFEIKDKQFDDCFFLDNNKIQFITPEYNLELSASSHETFLQIYTPQRANTIAIEPTTGVSNSFNNNIGLQVLKPRNTYYIDWEVKFF